MSRYDTSLQAPGLNLRPQDTSSQLVSALGSVFEGTTAAAAASARIERVKEAEKLRIRNDHERIAREQFTKAERARLVQEQAQAQVSSDKVSDKIYNLLMDPRAENPEWLLKQGIAGVDLSRSDMERDQWQKFTLAQQSSVRRLREKENQEAALDEQRTMRRQFKIMATQADANIDLDSMMRDPDNLLENMSDYYMTSMLTAAGDDIEDPTIRGLLSDVAVEHAIARFQREAYPKLQQSRQINQETMGREKINNLTESFLDGESSASDFLTSLDVTLTREFSERAPSDHERLRLDIVKGTLTELGKLPNGMTAVDAMAKADEIFDAIPPGYISDSEKRAYRDQFFDEIIPQAAKREASREANLALQELQLQTNADGTPKDYVTALMDAASPGPGNSPSILESRQERVLTELGLERGNPEHAIAIAVVQEQFNSLNAEAGRYAAKAANELGLGLAARSGQIRTDKDGTALAGSQLLNTNKIGSLEMDAIGQAMQGAGLNPEDYGIREGAIIDFNQIMGQQNGEAVVDLIVGQEVDLWRVNPQAAIPAELKDVVTRLMSEGGPGSLRAVQVVADRMLPHHRTQLQDHMTTDEMFRFSILRHGDEMGLQLSDVQAAIDIPPSVLKEAKTNYGIIFNENPDVIEDSKRPIMKSLEVLAEGFSDDVGEFQRTLVEDSSSRYFFLQTSIEARAIAESQGRSVEEDDYALAAAKVKAHMEKRGYRMAVFNGTGKFIYDPHGHMSSDRSVQETWSTQLRSRTGGGDREMLAEVLGIDYIPDPGTDPNAETLFRMGLIKRLTDTLDLDDPQFEEQFMMYRGVNIVWEPLRPNHPLVEPFLKSPDGGLPMIPRATFINQDGEEERVDIISLQEFVDSGTPYPFIARSQHADEIIVAEEEQAKIQSRQHALDWRKRLQEANRRELERHAEMADRNNEKFIGLVSSMLDVQYNPNWREEAEAAKFAELERLDTMADRSNTAIWNWATDFSYNEQWRQDAEAAKFEDLRRFNN